MTGSFRNSCDVLLLKEEWCSNEGGEWGDEGDRGDSGDEVDGGDGG